MNLFLWDIPLKFEYWFDPHSLRPEAVKLLVFKANSGSLFSFSIHSPNYSFFLAYSWFFCSSALMLVWEQLLNFANYSVNILSWSFNYSILLSWYEANLLYLLVLFEVLLSILETVAFLQSMLRLKPHHPLDCLNSNEKSWGSLTYYWAVASLPHILNSCVPFLLSAHSFFWSPQLALLQSRTTTSPKLSAFQSCPSWSEWWLKFVKKALIQRRWFYGGEDEEQPSLLRWYRECLLFHSVCLRSTHLAGYSGF